MTCITEIKKSSLSFYGELIVNFEEAINTAYPNVIFEYRSPSCYGGSADIVLMGNKLELPSGEYKSSKHYHNSGHGILEIETKRDCKLNLNKNPLFLLTGRLYNGDYRSLRKSYYLFGRNEDNSYFLHKVRPIVGETGSLEECRKWMWSIKNGEKIVARQGDLGFISRKSGKPSGTKIEGNILNIGNHNILCEEIRETKNKYFGFNCIAKHHEHDSVRVDGWSELRLAKVWSGVVGD